MREHFVGIEKISCIAAVATERIHQCRHLGDRDDVIAKPFLKMGGKIDQVKPSHKSIIQLGHAESKPAGWACHPAPLRCASSLQLFSLRNHTDGARADPACAEDKETLHFRFTFSLFD